MKLKRLMNVLLICVLVLPVSAMAREGARNWEIVNRIRLEYDDNIRQQERDTTSSFKIIEEIQFHVNFNLENTFVGLRYRPSFVWWENRSEDSTDLFHNLDFILNHEFTPRLSLSIKDTFRYAEQPELIERGDVVRQDSDFIFNTLSGALSYKMFPQTSLEASGRYDLLRYDDDAVAERQDFDLYAAGLTLGHQIMPETRVAGEIRFETIDYDSDEFRRDADTYQAGGSVEHTFNPGLLGNLRAGMQYKDFDADDISSDTSPFVSGSLTYLPSPSTRMTLGAGFTHFEADVFPYANQERSRAFASISHDLTARVTLNVAGTYTYAKYREDEVPAEARERLDIVEGDGTEEIIQLSTRISYQINRKNWLEAGWQYVDLDSDVRNDYDRNRFHVGWRTRL